MRRGSLSGLLAAALVLIGGGASVQARTDRFALVIGNNAGDAYDQPLRYAESDAARMAQVLGDIGGYPTENVVIGRGLDGQAMRRALISLNERVRRVASAPGNQAVLLVYYSGHADAEALHLGRSRLDIAELRELVSGSAAQFRVLILDACRSGALTRAKGGRAAPPFDIRLDDRLAGEGVVFLTSAAVNEDAQESDAVGGSVFTHHFLSGLLGAADDDGDGRVSLDEVYRYAYDATVRTSSRTLAGAQHPTFQFQLRGQGDLPLTFPGESRKDRGALVVPAGRSYLVMRGGATGPVVAEVTATDGSRRVSVAPGRYFVRGRLQEALLEGTVDVRPAEAAIIDEGRLERIAYARLVRKGSGDKERALAVTGGYRIRSPLWAGTSLCQGGYLAMPVVMRAFTISPRIAFCRGGFENAYLSASSDEIATEVAALRTWDFGALALSAGLDVGTALLVQRFTADRAAPGRTSGAAQGGALVGLEVPVLRGGLHFVAEVGVQVYFFQQQDGAAVRWTAAPTVRGALGLGHYW